MNESLLFKKTPLFELRSRMSVRVGGLWLHVRHLPEVLSSFSDPIFHWTGDSHTEMCLRGSGTLLELNGRYFVVATQHQVRDYPPETISVLGREGTHWVTSGGFHSITLGQDEEEKCGHDLCAFDFTNPVREGAINRNRFFSLLPSRVVSDGDHIIAANIYGHAFQDQILHYDETGTHDYRLMHVRLRKRELTCEYAGDGLDSSVAKWRRVSSEPFQPNGFSGAPVFLVVETGEAYTCRFAGITVLGGGMYLQSIKGERIRNFLLAIIEK